MIFCRIHGTAMPCDEFKGPITIHYPTMDRAYPKHRYPYVSLGPEDPPYSLGDMVTASIHVWDSRKLVPKDCETSAESRKNHIKVDVGSSDPTVSAIAVPSNVNPVQSKNPVPASIGEGRTNAYEAMEVSDNIFSEETDEGELVKFDSIASLVCK